MVKKDPVGLSVVIPIFNEVDNIPHLLKNLIKFSQSSKFSHEFILVDGNSTDGTREALKNFSSNPKIKIIFLSESKGYGGDIKEGLKHAHYSFLGWTHADLQTDISDLEVAFNKIISLPNETIIKGKRENRKKLESFFTFGMEVVVLYFLKHYINDINAQPKLFSKNFYNTISGKFWPNDFSLDLFLLFEAKKKNLTIETIPVKFNIRQFGEAKGGGSWSSRRKLIQRTFKYVRELSIKIKP
ncbi:glycosyltransferase family 2 protein [Gammaproteobacteria bacterium]|jgi:glycosyltransferase involved in cell wall biosynthesis|nr:glycosyltransferase family 2 protein [Gammaproteobacteria bacterium]